MTPYGLQGNRYFYRLFCISIAVLKLAHSLRRLLQPAFCQGSKVTTAALLAVSILLKPTAISTVEFNRKHAASLRLRLRSIVPKSLNKSSRHYVSHRTFPAVAASCCKLQDVPAARICGNDYRSPIARSERQPACHSAYRVSPMKSTARCNRHRNRGDKSSQSFFTTRIFAVRYSLVSHSAIRSTNQRTVARFVTYFRERRDFTGDCTVQRLTLRRWTLTLRRPKNYVFADRSNRYTS